MVRFVTEGSSVPGLGLLYGRRQQGKSLLDRLDAAAAKLRQTQMVVRMTVSAAGFTTDLHRRALRRADVQLVDLQRLYHGA